MQEHVLNWDRTPVGKAIISGWKKVAKTVRKSHKKIKPQVRRIKMMAKKMQMDNTRVAMQAFEKMERNPLKMKLDQAAQKVAKKVEAAYYDVARQVDRGWRAIEREGMKVGEELEDKMAEHQRENMRIMGQFSRDAEEGMMILDKSMMELQRDVAEAMEAEYEKARGEQTERPRNSADEEEAEDPEDEEEEDEEPEEADDEGEYDEEDDYGLEDDEGF